MLNLRGPDVTSSRPPPSQEAGNYDIVHFCHLAAVVVTLYDHVLMLDLEVEYIWKQKRSWSASKALFILARYVGDLLLISNCVGKPGSLGTLDSTEIHEISVLESHFWALGVVGLRFVGTGSMVIILITQFIMQLRIKALYGKIMSRLITIFWTFEVIAVLGLGVASLVAIDVTPYTLESVRMCNPTYLPRFAFLFWVPVIVFETFLFLLAFRMAYHNYLEIGSWRGVSIFHVVLRDNFIFFVCAFALYVITAATWLTANPRYFTVPGAFACSFTTNMGCRLILNLCQVYHVPNDMAVRPHSIWAASDAIRFKAQVTSNMAVSVATGQDMATEMELLEPASSKFSTGSARGPRSPVSLEGGV